MDGCIERIAIMLETSTIIFMGIILAYTWGGLFFFLNKAYKKEKIKNLKK